MGEATHEFDTTTPEIDGLEDQTVLTVDGLNTAISDVLETPPDDLYFDYVVGDVSDCHAVNGHLHFDLDHGDATIHCVVFEYRRDRVPDDLDDGLQIGVSGDLSYYEPRGRCSVLVDDVVTIGEGAYQQLYEENREILADDGLLADEKKQSLPAYPETIGLVTSLESDAREDAVTSIHNRHPDIDIIIQHTPVQGDDAMPGMMSAISELDRDPDVDVIVLTRGGGADTTLRVFNETPLCRVIFRTDTPIVVGVGHESDQTLAEDVADQRVMTPTHAGEIVPRKADLVEQHADLAADLDTAYRQTVDTHIRDVEDTLDTAYTNHVQDVITATHTDLTHAFETFASERLTALDTQLTHAVETLHQEKTHEQETRRYQRQQKRQRIAIIILLILLLILLVLLVGL